MSYFQCVCVLLYGIQENIFVFQLGIYCKVKLHFCFAIDENKVELNKILCFLMNFCHVIAPIFPLNADNFS